MAKCINLLYIHRRRVYSDSVNIFSTCIDTLTSFLFLCLFIVLLLEFLLLGAELCYVWQLSSSDQ